jgi:hypothetical protein
LVILVLLLRISDRYKRISIVVSFALGDSRMIEEIIKEKTSADHLMYVSLKYTKTCDVILNLLARWKSLIEISFDAILEKRCEEGKIPCMHATPIQRIEFMKKYFAKDKAIQDVIPLYIFFKRVPDLSKTRSGEFRKNVNLKVRMTPTRVIDINMEKLGEYYDVVEAFSVEVKKIIA